MVHASYFYPTLNGYMLALKFICVAYDMSSFFQNLLYPSLNYMTCDHVTLLVYP